MDCPKCSGTMTKIADESFSAMKCSGCSGIWFSHGDHEIAKKIKGISAIDDNDTHAAAAFNDFKIVSCPECDMNMIRMIDKDQFHIHFDACTHCHGVYFDSGEFKDLAEHKFSERIKQAFETFKSNLKH